MNRNQGIRTRPISKFHSIQRLFTITVKARWPIHMLTFSAYRCIECVLYGYLYKGVQIYAKVDRSVTDLRILNDGIVIQIYVVPLSRRNFSRMRLVYGISNILLCRRYFAISPRAIFNRNVKIIFYFSANIFKYHFFPKPWTLVSMNLKIASKKVPVK